MKARLVPVIPKMFQGEVSTVLPRPAPPDRRRTPLEASFVLGLPHLKPLPGLYAMSIDVVNDALRDERVGTAVQIAAAHVVATNAIIDPYFRGDRFKSRVDEWMFMMWCVAQEVFEANAHFAPKDQCSIVDPTRARGLGAEYDGLSSARCYWPRGAEATQ